MMGRGVTTSRPSSLMFFMWKGIGIWAGRAFAGARPHGAKDVAVDLVLAVDIPAA